jgi:hypothetical protein
MIVTRVGDLVHRTKDGRTSWVLDGQTIVRSGDAVCDLHHAHGEEEHKFIS